MNGHVAAFGCAFAGLVFCVGWLLGHGVVTDAVCLAPSAYVAGKHLVALISCPTLPVMRRVDSKV